MLLVKRVAVLLWGLASVIWLLVVVLHQDWANALVAALNTGFALTAWLRLRKGLALWFTRTATRRLALVTAVAIAAEVAFGIFIIAAGVDDSKLATPAGVLLMLGVFAAFFGYWWREATKRPNAS